MIFDEVLQVVENTTSNFSERADAKYSARGNSIAFNFILRRIFGNCMYSYTYFYISHFKIIFFRNPFLCCLRTSIFHVKRIGKASIQKTTLGVSTYLPNVIVSTFCKQKGTKNYINDCTCGKYCS